MPATKEKKPVVSTAAKLSQGRSEPHSAEAEVNLLGCILGNPALAIDIISKLTEEHFYLRSHKTIFAAMRQLVKENKPIELPTLTDALERNDALAEIGGIEYLLKITDSVVSSVRYNVYLDMVTRCYVLRNLINTCCGLIDKAYTTDNSDVLIADAEKQIYDINRGNISKSIVNVSESIGEVMKRFDSAFRNKGAYTGVTSGIRRLDSRTRGFQKGSLVILAATTGMGKTSFAMNIAEHAALDNKTVAVFSLEMPNTEIGQRLICSFAGIDMSRALNGDLNDSDWVRIADASNLLSKLNIFVDDSSITTPNDILAKCRRIQARYGLDLVIIDYLQLLTLEIGKPSENRQREVTEISRNLKIMAKELSVPVLALSQLSREAAKRKLNEGKEPALSDLRESGAIEQDADIVMFIHRPDTGEEEDKHEPVMDAQIILAKHRNGPTDNIPVKWLSQIVRFVNDDEEAQKKLAENARNENEVLIDDYGPVPEAPQEQETVLPIDDDEDGSGGLGF